MFQDLAPAETLAQAQPERAFPPYKFAAGHYLEYPWSYRPEDTALLGSNRSAGRNAARLPGRALGLDPDLPASSSPPAGGDNAINPGVWGRAPY